MIAADRRGPVDTNASSESRLCSVCAREWQLGAETIAAVARPAISRTSAATARAYTHNATARRRRQRGFDAKISRAAERAAVERLRTAAAFSQHLQFGQRGARRSRRRRSINFNVPADAAGGSAVWSMMAGDHRLVLGGDARWVEGETNEAFFWDGTRVYDVCAKRAARRFSPALFAEDTWSVSPQTTIVGGAALGSLGTLRWFPQGDGARDRRRADGYADLRIAHGNEINGRLGARVQATTALAVRGAFYSGFRVPTLNELYRPFRVGNDVTEANAALAPEHLFGGELARGMAGHADVSHSGHRLRQSTGRRGQQRHHRRGPGTFDPGGFIPAGGVLRQRQNVDLVVAPGFEGDGGMAADSDGALARRLFVHAPDDRTRGRSGVASGNCSRKLRSTFSPAAWNGRRRRDGWSSAQVRYSDRQFEDDQNSRVLAPFATVDAAVGYEFSARGSAALRVENLFDTEIESGKSADGLDFARRAAAGFVAGALAALSDSLGLRHDGDDPRVRRRL